MMSKWTSAAHRSGLESLTYFRGRVALYAILKALGIGKGDEVICPDLTFIAPANMIVLSGAKLVLVDIPMVQQYQKH